MECSHQRRDTPHCPDRRNRQLIADLERHTGHKVTLQEVAA